MYPKQRIVSILQNHLTIDFNISLGEEKTKYCGTIFQINELKKRVPIAYNSIKMNWEGKKVLVTGAGGFIGSHLVQHLMKLGVEVRSFIRYTSHGSIGNLKFVPNYEDMEIVYGDLKDPYAVQRALTDVNYVFHLAALISIPYSYVHPREYFENNVNSILNLLQAAEEMGTDFIVHTSTSEVYGTAKYIPIDEKHPLTGQSPYSASKIAADKAVESFHLSFDSPVSTLRPFNNYGPRQSLRAITPTIISQLLSGQDLRLGDITTSRDFLYVKDTVRGFTQMIEKRDKARGKTINIGTGTETTVEDLAKLLIAKINPQKKILLDSAKLRPNKSEVVRLCADISLAEKILEWTPSFTFEQGLEKTIAWIKENQAMYSQKQSYL